MRTKEKIIVDDLVSRGCDPARIDTAALKELVALEADLLVAFDSLRLLSAAFDEDDVQGKFDRYMQLMHDFGLTPRAICERTELGGHQ